MLKQEQIAEMAKRAGIKAEDLTTALTSDKEVELTLPEVVTYLKPDFETFQGNLKKASYDDGKVAGVEMAVKEVKTAKGLTFEGKTITALVDHVIEATKKEAGQEPEARYKDLEGRYKAMQEQKEAEKRNTEALLTQANQALFDLKTIDLLTSTIEGETIIPKKQIAALFRMENQIVEQDGQFFVKKGTDILKDDKLSPIPAANIFKEFVDKTYLKKTGDPNPPAGGGKKDKDGILLFSTQTEWREYWTGKGITTTHPDAQKSLVASQKQTGFKYD